MIRDRLRAVPLYYYTAVSAGLAVLLAMVVTRIFAVSHPMRYLFLALLCIGFAPGYLRYKMRIVGKAGEGRAGWRRYAPVLVLVGAYLAIRYLVRNTVRHQLSGDEYGIAMGFFILGLFSAYYVPYTLHLWRNRPGRQGPPGPTPG